MQSTGIKKRKTLGILRIYTFSCLFFMIMSVFNIYNYKVYDTWSLIVYYIYEVILWLGIKAGGGRYRIRFASGGKDEESSISYSFSIKKCGKVIIYVIYAGALLSFFYFLILYRGSFNITSFGASVKAEFDEVARTKLEVITQFILYAGSATYLMVYSARASASRTMLRMARICLFLPGLRGAFLGRRFTLAVEVLVYFFTEFESIRSRIGSMSKRSKKNLKRIIIVLGIVAVVLLYIFSRRIVYSPETLFVAEPGDMELKPFWKWVYGRIGNGMSVFSYVSFYAGHAPCAFSYSYANAFLAYPRYWGLQTFRVLIQIVTSLFGLSPSYAEMARNVPGIARYTGYAGTVISDFGLYLAPIVSFMFGFTFGRIERGKDRNSICRCLYPIVQVACLFAPVYFFSVGALDQVAIWVVVLPPICLRRVPKGALNDIFGNIIS